MPSFSEFLDSLDADAAKRGKQFENFVKWFLINDPQWATQVEEVWLWDEWPQRWGPDCGIDLVFKHKDGQTWAVQSKCYDPRYNITKHDVDKFLSESNRASIDKRLLIATTDGLGNNAKQVCDAQDKEVVRYLLSNFEDADIEYPSSFAELNKTKPKPKPTPKEHQVKAIEAVTRGFADTDRGQLIMACGTGKTFTTLWIKEALKSESTLILLPSLGLLSQTLHEWTAAKNQEFAVLCVCSDESVGKKGGDEAVHDIADLAFPVTSDPVKITKFLNQAGPKVVFSTYQSSNLIADAQANQSVISFNLAIADEAHRCAGDKAGNFATILDGQRIRADKRLFTTATPRTYSTALKKGAEGRGIEIVGMDNEEIFGKQLYTLNFGQAIKDELLTDYRVVIVGVDSPMIASYIENREFVKTESGIEKDAETLAAQVALLKAMKDFDLHRMISFHSRVNRAEGFAKDLTEVASWVDAKHRPSGELKTDFVSGDMPTFARRQKLTMLKNTKDNERALLTNARCLSEGVDVPSLDGVAFIDPRASQVDIIQAVGRAIRLSPNKKVGTIVLPVFIGHGDNQEQALDEGNFKPIWDVLNALKSHDDVLADELDQMRIGMGKRGSSKMQGGFSKIEIDLPATIDKSFSEAIQTRLVETTTSSWDFMFGLLLEYKSTKGDCEVLGQCITPKGYKLGIWVHNQRQQQGQLSADRVERLNNAGFVWSPFDKKWEEGYSALKSYYDREKNCNVAGKHIERGYKLGQWVNVQRSLKKTILSPDRILRLDLIGFNWDVIESNWENGYSELKAFYEREGHSMVSSRAPRNDNSFKLGSWVAHQRQNKDSLNKNQIQRLNEIQFIWDPISYQWDKNFDALLKFHQEYGHCVVPKRELFGGFFLGHWVGTQRATKDSMSVERRNRLTAIGFIWDAKGDYWEDGLTKLKQFKEREGHCRVVKGYKEDSFALNIWVGSQRENKDKLSSEKIKILDDMGFIWDVNETLWEEGFQCLLKFIQREGHCRVPARHKEGDYPLGGWVSKQRKYLESELRRLSPERKKRLNEIGFIWKPQINHLNREG